MKDVFEKERAKELKKVEKQMLKEAYQRGVDNYWKEKTNCGAGTLIADTITESMVDGFFGILAGTIVVSAINTIVPIPEKALKPVLVIANCGFAYLASHREAHFAGMREVSRTKMAIKEATEPKTSEG